MIRENGVYMSLMLTHLCGIGGGLEDRVKWTRIAENLPVLENVYLHRREYVSGGPKGLPRLTQPVANGGEAAAKQHMNHLADFSKDLTKLASNTELKVQLTGSRGTQASGS